MARLVQLGTRARTAPRAPAPPARVLLINTNRFPHPYPVTPFGLCCVAAAVEADGHEVQVLDLCFVDAAALDAEIGAAVAAFRPDVVGLSVRNIDNGTGYATQFLLGDLRRDVVLPLRRAFDGPIVLGGPAVGVSGEQMLAYLDLELAIQGDGEQAMVELLRRRGDDEALAASPGLIRRVGGATVVENPPAWVEDLDALPWARAHRYVDVRRYASWGAPLQVQSKRGCALHCSYCTYNRIEGKAWRLRSPASVAAEIEEMVRATGITTVEFTDSTFNYPTDHAKAVLRALIPVRARLGLRLRTMGLNPGGVDAELVALMKEAGFTEVDLGAESGNDQTLRSLGKSFRVDALERAARLLREADIAVMWFLLAGAPGETPETLAETFRTIDRLVAPWDLVNVGVGVRVYKGAPLARKVLRDDPAATTDDFLSPVSLTPPAELDVIKALVKQHALGRSNYFMYDEDEDRTPPGLVRVVGAVLRRVAPAQPVWRLFILVRWLQRLTGVNALQRRAHDETTRQALARLARLSAGAPAAAG